MEGSEETLRCPDACSLLVPSPLKRPERTADDPAHSGLLRGFLRVGGAALEPATSCLVRLARWPVTSCRSRRDGGAPLLGRAEVAMRSASGASTELSQATPLRLSESSSLV